MRSLLQLCSNAAAVLGVSRSVLARRSSNAPASLFVSIAAADAAWSSCRGGDSRALLESPIVLPLQFGGVDLLAAPAAAGRTRHPEGTSHEVHEGARCANGNLWNRARQDRERRSCRCVGPVVLA